MDAFPVEYCNLPSVYTQWLALEVAPTDVNINTQILSLVSVEQRMTV